MLKKRPYGEFVEKKKEFNMNNLVDVKSRLDSKRQKLLDMTREIKGLNMQIKCLESQLNKLCDHKWYKVREETGVYNRAPLKCINCGTIKVSPGA